MANEITTAFQRKEYGWFAFYIFVLVLGARVAGIGGIVGATIISFGLYRTIKHAEYSVFRKIISSVAYVAAGLASSLIIVVLLSWLIRTFTHNRMPTPQETASNTPALNVVGSTSGIPLATPTSLSAPITSQASVGKAQDILPPKDAGVVRLEPKPYINQKYGFKITSPDGWALDESGDADTVAYFLSRTVDREDSYQWQVSINIGVKPGNQGFSLDQYMTAYKNQIAQWFPDLQVVTEEKKVINGHESVLISSTYTNEGHKFRNVQLIMIEGDNAYSVSGTALNSTWEQYKEVLAASVESFALVS